MSTVMRPRGPLPPQVYWTRRLLLVGVVMLVGALLWWVMPGVGGSGNAAANPNGPHQPSGQQPQTTPTTSGSTTQADPESGPTTRGQGPGSTRHTSASRPTAHPPTSKPPSQRHPQPQHRVLPQPSGPCDPKTLTLSVVVPSARIGKGTTVGLRMSTGDSSTCSLAITPSLLETRITSGPALVWQSTSCPDALPARNVVVRPQPRVVYSYTWDGQVNPDSCSASDRIAQPGGYWAEAALIGGEPHKTYFEVTSPATS